MPQARNESKMRSSIGGVDSTISIALFDHIEESRTSSQPDQQWRPHVYSAPLSATPADSASCPHTQLSAPQPSARQHHSSATMMLSQASQPSVSVPVAQLLRITLEQRRAALLHDLFHPADGLAKVPRYPTSWTRHQALCSRATTWTTSAVAEPKNFLIACTSMLRNITHI